MKPNMGSLVILKGYQSQEKSGLGTFSFLSSFSFSSSAFFLPLFFSPLIFLLSPIPFFFFFEYRIKRWEW